MEINKDAIAALSKRSDILPIEKLREFIFEHETKKVSFRKLVPKYNVSRSTLSWLYIEYKKEMVQVEAKRKIDDEIDLEKLFNYDRNKNASTQAHTYFELPKRKGIDFKFWGFIAAFLVILVAIVLNAGSGEKKPTPKLV